MTTRPTAPATPRRSRWLRRLGWGGAGLLSLLLVLYFVATSGAFFKGVILPKLGQAMNAEVTAREASISPFSSVTLRGFTMKTTGNEPVVSIDEVRLRYSLMSLLRGHIKVDEAALVEPRIRIEQRADGTSNLDPLLKRSTGAAQEPPPPPGSGSSSPLRLDITGVTVTNGSIHLEQKEAGNNETRVQIDRLNFALRDLRNGQTAVANFDAVARWSQQATGAISAIEAPMKMELRVGLTPALGLTSARGGFSLTFSQATGAAAQLAGAGIRLDCDVTPTEVKGVTLRAAKGPQALGELSLSGPYDLVRNEGTLNLVLTNLNLRDWRAFAADLDPAGRVSAGGRLRAQQAGRQLGFEFFARLDELAASVGTNRLAGLNLDLSTGGTVTNFTQIQLGPTRLTLARTTRPAATFNAAGLVSLDPAHSEVEIGGDTDLAELAQILPDPALRLSSGRLRVNARVRQQGRTQSVAGNLQLASLTGRLAGTEVKDLALGVGFDLSASDGKVIDLRRVAVDLARTARAITNQMELTGRIDVTRTNAVDGALKLSADTLDITPYYDLLAGQPAGQSRTQPTTTPPRPTAPGTPAPTEPEPIRFPVGQMVLDVRVGRLWLREIEAANVQGSLKIEPSGVTIRPLTLTMNGAPLDGDVALDLGVRGWRYAISFNAAGVPIAPLADSFAPDYRGRAKGDLWAKTRIEGAGVTGPNLRKNLTAHLGLSFTNADIQIVGSRLKGFLVPIAAAVNAPGLLDSPLKWVTFDASAGAGKLNLSQLALVSPLFTAATMGEVGLADDLSASRIAKWPMTFQLERTLAERVRLAPKDTPASATFVALPDFVRVAGTLNEPKPELDLKALAGAALMKYVDRIPGVDERTSNLLKGMGGLLTGQKPAAGTNVSVTTNAPAGTNKPAGLLDLLKRPKSP